MKKLFIVASLFVALFLGYFWGSSGQKEMSLCPELEYSSLQCPRCPDIPSNNPAAAKQQAKLYGDVFLLFLANLGIRLQPENKEKLLHALQAPEKYLKEEELSQKLEPEEPVVQATPEVTILEKEEGAGELQVDSGDAYKRNSKFGRVIERLSQKEPLVTFAHAKYINTNFGLLEKVNGEYRGKIHWLNDKQKPSDDVFLSVKFQTGKNNRVDGSYMLELSSDKKGVYSSRSGTGDNQAIRLTEDRKFFILEAGPEEFFIFENKKNLQTGLFYQKSEKTGIVVLEEN